MTIGWGQPLQFQQGSEPRASSLACLLFNDHVGFPSASIAKALHVSVFRGRRRTWSHVLIRFGEGRRSSALAEPLAR